MNFARSGTLLPAAPDHAELFRPRPLFPYVAKDRPKPPPARHAFNKQALSNLSLADRILFEYFGQGPVEAVPVPCIHYAFEAQAAARPHALAVRHEYASMTYGELERQANRLAAVLHDHGIGPGDHVGLFLRRSIPMIVGILAILKVGAAYVPQHVGAAPPAQLKHIADVAAIRVVLTLSTLQADLPVADTQTCIAIDQVMQQPLNEENHAVPWKPTTMLCPDHTCYILFTSGTTGTPNGVQVTHGNLCNVLLTAPGNLGIRPGHRVAHILSIAFDMAAWEILGCLGNGGTLIIRGKDILKAVQQADVVIATPSVLSSLDAQLCRNVRIVAVAGEPCPKPLADTWAAFAAFHNACGPTETTIVNTVQRYDPWSAQGLSIGRPTPNNTVYILDENMQPCPIGETGEMWAGGACVSAGYLHNDDLNQERYAPDPFLSNGHMMFRTRDLGRWNEYGELEHFGRTDDQVKVRGFRVELDSVSAVLETLEGCMQAVTLKLNSEQLVACVAPACVDGEAAKQAVAAQLPYYCVPTFILAFDALPRTNRGKVDKQTLLALAVAHNEQEAVSC